MRPGLDDVRALLGLASPASAARCSSAGTRSSSGGAGGGQVHGGGEGVVARLGGVHLVVRVHRAGRAGCEASAATHLVDVHVRATSRTRSGRRRPGTGRRARRRRPPAAAAATASATSAGSTPSRALTRAAAALTAASARTTAGSTRHAADREVLAPPAGSARPTGRAAGTATSPIVSRSIRTSSSVVMRHRRGRAGARGRAHSGPTREVDGVGEGAALALDVEQHLLAGAAGALEHERELGRRLRRPDARAPRRGAARGPPRRGTARAYTRVLPGCTRKPGPLSTSSSSASTDAGRRPGTASAMSATVDVHARVVEQAARRRHQPLPDPGDERRVQLDDVDPGDPGVGQQRRRGVAEPQSADDDVQVVAAELVERQAGQRPLGLGLLGVHGEDAVDDELEHVARSAHLRAPEQGELGDPVVRPHHHPRAPALPAPPPLHVRILPAPPHVPAAPRRPTLGLVVTTAGVRVADEPPVRERPAWRPTRARARRVGGPARGRFRRPRPPAPPEGRPHPQLPAPRRCRQRVGLRGRRVRGRCHARARRAA